MREGYHVSPASVRCVGAGTDTSRMTSAARRPIEWTLQVRSEMREFLEQATQNSKALALPQYRNYWKEPTVILDDTSLPKCPSFLEDPDVTTPFPRSDRYYIFTFESLHYFYLRI